MPGGDDFNPWTHGSNGGAGAVEYSLGEGCGNIYTYCLNVGTIQGVTLAGYEFFQTTIAGLTMAGQLYSFELAVALSNYLSNEQIVCWINNNGEYNDPSPSAWTIDLSQITQVNTFMPPNKFQFTAEEGTTQTAIACRVYLHVSPVMINMGGFAIRECV